MFFPQSYTLAVSLCFITMICWGSWANTQKLATKEWPFQLFYWDYTIGILILALVLGLTLGSSGELGRSFVVDLSQGNLQPMLLALAGGVVFNIANLLLVAAIDFAGMAVAFPVGIGLALVLGVLVNYVANPGGGKEGLKYPWGNEISRKKARYFPSFGTSAVGRYSANNFGLFDTAGNVCEWCADWFDKDYYSTLSLNEPTKDPAGPGGKARLKVLRGRGSWGGNVPRRLRCSYRYYWRPDDEDYNFGFRCVRESSP